MSMLTNALARHGAYQTVDSYRLEEVKITSDVHVPDTASAVPITMTATSATSPVHPISVPKTLRWNAAWESPMARPYPKRSLGSAPAAEAFAAAPTSSTPESRKRAGRREAVHAREPPTARYWRWRSR
ncbi:unnamed protein product [Miscanthus lutarioriparius]|uniref:Uncharacterized protein n=1 Tax=Miscanthus lutarioriparius TaxID=422564 RepID=A0A811P8I5_9POAL|nr:unnamed protein product [Miscanthus lutarioriparius]